MSKASIPIASVAFVASLLAAHLASPVIGSARADDCVAAPNGVSPRGQHWYYRLDPATRKKCWYLHALMRHPHAAARNVSVDGASADGASQDEVTASTTGSLGAPQAAALPANSSDPTSAADAKPAAPQIRILSVKTVAVPFVAETSQDAQARAAQTAAVPSPPSEPSSAPTPDQPQAVHTAQPAAHEEPATAGAKSAPDAVSQTTASSASFTKPKPMEMFFLLAVAASLLAFSIAILSKAAARRRTPRISDDGGVSWNGYSFGERRYDEGIGFAEDFVPIAGPAEYGLGEPPEQEWVDQPLPAPSQTAPPSPARVASSESRESRDIERALRALRQARRERMAS